MARRLVGECRATTDFPKTVPPRSLLCVRMDPMTREIPWRGKGELQRLLSDGALWAGEEESPGTRINPSKPSSLLLPFGFPEIDSTLGGGLELGALHELGFNFLATAEGARSATKRWFPPHQILALLAGRNALRSHPRAVTIWIGRRCWPTPHLLDQVAAFLGNDDWQKRCFFLEPNEKSDRLWSAVQGLQSSALSTIILDGSRFDFIATRRLQLAAAATTTLLLVTRPPWELSLPSAARTRWCVVPEPNEDLKKRDLVQPSSTMRYRIELHRARGITAMLHWSIEWQWGRYGKTDCVTVPAALSEALPRRAAS